MDAIVKRGPDSAIEHPVPASWQSMSRQLPAIVVSDQRKALRRRTDLPGYLLVEAHEPSVPCKVCNLSATGAMIKLQVPPSSAAVGNLPNRFTLVLTHYKQETRIECVVVRHRVLEVGVRFHGQFQTVKRLRSLSEQAKR